MTISFVMTNLLKPFPIILLTTLKIGTMTNFMAIYKPYPKYKNSNIPWLGEIPEHWEVMRAKTIGWFNGSTVDKKIIEGESLVRIVNFTDVFNNRSLEIHNKTFMKVSAKPSQITSFNLKIGDVLFTPSSEDRL